MSKAAVKDESTALVEDTKSKTLQAIDADMQNMAVSVGASKTVSKAATRSADVTGELMPFVLGQLQASLESLGGGGSLLRRDSCPAGSNTSSSPSSSAAHPPSNFSRHQSPTKSDLQLPSTSGPEESHAQNNSNSAPTEECLFDSGTESGEDGGGHDTSLGSKAPPPAEFSSFMEGLRDTLSREGLGNSTLQSAGDKTVAVTPVTLPESDLIQQVEKVLTQLRDTLVKDPQSQNVNEGLMTPDLIALIDRLKASLKKPEAEVLPLPFVVGSPSPPKESNPTQECPNVTRKLPWASAAEGPEMAEGPWRYRAAKKRGLIRSRSIGLSDEEIEEARRHMQEEAFRSALRDDIPPSDVKLTDKWTRRGNKTTGKEDAVARRLSSYDDSSFQNENLKNTRAFSLASESEQTDEDPSRSFFTPAEVVQIAIHKAAIQKQVSQEEDLRRNSLTAAPESILAAKQAVTGVKRDFTIGLPKPYVAPTSDELEGRAVLRRPSGSLMVTKPTQRSIENVQISLNESGDMPQLQIAITLNTNNAQSGQDQNLNRAEGTARIQTEEGRGQGEGSSDESSKSSSYRHRPKSERKKKMKRANTLDGPPQSSDMTDFEVASQKSDDESRDEDKAPEPIVTPAAGTKKGMFLFDKKDPPPKPAFLTANDNYWNNRFSTLKTSFESSSQGSSPSLSPVPQPYSRGHHHAPVHSQVHFNAGRESSVQPTTKPVWAAATPSPTSQRSPSGVKNKLSVFENKNQVPVQISSGPIRGEESWQLPNLNSQPTRTSGIFKTRESVERKLAPVEQTTHALPLPSRSSVARDYEPEGLESSTSLPLSPPINEGVHTVHATKSALEAMQRQFQGHATQNQPTGHSHGHFQPHALLDREATPPWQKVSQPMAQFLAKFNQFNSPAPPPPIPPRANIALKATEFENLNQFGGQRENLSQFGRQRENLNQFGGQRQPNSLVKQRTNALESNQNEPKLGMFRLAKSFDHPAPPKQHDHFVSDMRKSFPFQSSPNLETDDTGLVMNSPVVSRVMRGPQQQRATISHQEISTLGPNHPSADRIRNAQSAHVPVSSQFQPSSTPNTAPEQHSKFPARNIQYPPLVKSRSGDILTTSTSKGYQNQVAPPQLPVIHDSTPPPSIPRQKSFTEFPPTTIPAPNSKSKIFPHPGPPPPITTSGFTNLRQSQNVSASNPSLPSQPQSKSPGNFPSQSVSQDLKRTSSGSSIFDRARSLYMSSRDAQGVVPPKTPAQNTQRKKPPSLPRTNTIFPKQYEAQMSPESADKKQREVEAYFKLEGANEKPSHPEPPPASTVSIPSRYSKVKGASDPRIRKSASQGQILNRQKSFSDGEEEDESVDKIFESLFKASVESKMAKTSVSGNRSLSEQAEIKATKSATENKAVEKSASVEASKTPTGSTVVKKQSSVSTKSSSFSSSTTTSHISTEKVTSGALEGPKSQKNVAGKGAGTLMVNTSSVASIKDGLLAWCQGRTRGYKNVNITNFSSSWSDGLAFCALIHHFYPNAFDFDTLTPDNPKKNFDLAFDLADKLAGIYPLLETEDMLIMGKNPDYKCIFTYVNAIYLKLKDM